MSSSASRCERDFPSVNRISGFGQRPWRDWDALPFYFTLDLRPSPTLSIPPNQGAKFKAKGNASNMSGTKVVPLWGVDIVVTLLIQPECALESRGEASSGIDFFYKTSKVRI